MLENNFKYSIQVADKVIDVYYDADKKELFFPGDKVDYRNALCIIDDINCTNVYHYLDVAYEFTRNEILSILLKVLKLIKEEHK